MKRMESELTFSERLVRRKWHSPKNESFMASVLCGFFFLTTFLTSSNALYVGQLKAGHTYIVEKPKIQSKEICQTRGCVYAASSILQNMDETVDPCDDFYRFACGNFVKKTVIPEYKSTVTVFDNIDDELAQQLRTTIEEKMTEKVERPFRLLQSYYRACMNQSQINSNSEKDVQEILKRLGGWPVLLGDKWDERNWDWKETLFKFQSIGYSSDHLITLDIDVDLKDNTKRALTLDQATTILPQEYLIKGLEDKVIQSYFKMMVDLAEYFGAERTSAKKELLEVINLEVALANISLPSEKRRDSNLLYNPMTIKQLSQNYPYLQWTDYINSMLAPHAKLEERDVMIVTVPSFFDKLEKLLSQTSKRTVANYIMWRLIAESVDQMNDKIRDIVREFESTLTGTTVRVPRWKECVKDMTNSMSLAASAMYVKRHFDDSAKKNAVEMIERIRISFKYLLQKVTWMDEKTRKAALEKLETIVPFIAYPDELKDSDKLDKYYRSLEILEDNYLKSRLNLKLFDNAHEIKRYREPVNKTDWVAHGYSAVVNAFYNPSENSIQFPAGILQGVFFDNDRPKYLNYGGIGFVMGHEMTHGFDDQGRQFDKDGNLVDWWQKETEQQYLKKAECIIEQYGNYTVKDVNLHINGINTQGENIADNGGIKEAYFAYNTWEKENGVEPALPGLPQYTSQQMFWLGAANVWCTKVRPEALKVAVITDPHSPGEFRVQGPLSNMPEFAKDFNCPLGSAMNPTNKCTVW